MSDIPYSVRDKPNKLTAIKGFNFDSIANTELFKKQDSNNITGTKIYSTGTDTSKTISFTTDGFPIPTQVGYIKGEIDGVLRKLYLNTSGDVIDGITITSQGRLGIGVTNPEEGLELDGNIQLDTGGAQRGRVIFYDKQDDHEHAEVEALGEGTDGGALVFYTKEDLGNVTEKLRINNKGAFGIGGTNYGTTGQVLVSNGSAALPSWQGPSLLSGSGTGNAIIPLNTITALNWATITTEGSAPASDLPAGTSVWTASSSGLYHIVGHSFHTSAAYDQISNHHLYLEFRINSGATFSSIAEDQFALGAPSDRASVVSCNISKYVSIDTGNQLRLTVFCRVQSGTSYINYDNGRTIFQIFKVK